jgi:hypothetical protein
VTVSGNQQVAVRQQEMIRDHPLSVQAHETRFLDLLQAGRLQGTVGDLERESLAQGKQRDERGKALVKIPDGVRFGSDQEAVQPLRPGDRFSGVPSCRERNPQRVEHAGLSCPQRRDQIPPFRGLYRSTFM